MAGVGAGAGAGGNAGMPIKKASPLISVPCSTSPGCSRRGEVGSAPAMYCNPAPTREASVTGGARGLQQPLPVCWRWEHGCR